MSSETDDLTNRFHDKLKYGHHLLTSLETLKELEGVSKLKKKIQKELMFLNKVLNSGLTKNEHLLSTNLHHFGALVSCIFQSSDVVSVLETKSYKSQTGECKKLCIDIVCESGQTWIKVVARNPNALSQILSGNGEYGQKSIVDHAIDYTECAKQNHYMFKQPTVYFYFSSGVTQSLSKRLKEFDVNVIGFDIDTDALTSLSNGRLTLPDSFNHNTLTCNMAHDYASRLNNFDVHLINLDVSSMLAYVSALTNGCSHYIFKEPLLNEQVKWERNEPVKPILDSLFLGKTLICCETASKSFKDILGIIGGPTERQRAEKLMSSVEIVPDVPFNKLRLGGRIKPRSLVIFGTGWYHKAITVTSNEGFIRAAKHQGVDFAVFTHKSRALTEIKQEELRQL